MTACVQITEGVVLHNVGALLCTHQGQTFGVPVSLTLKKSRKEEEKVFGRRSHFATDGGPITTHHDR